MPVRQLRTRMLIRVSFYCLLKIELEEWRNVRNKLKAITLAAIFMIKILTSSQVYRLPRH